MTDRTQWISTRPNEIALTAFGPVSESLYAAEVTDNQGRICLWVAEPLARVEAHGTYGGEWDDVAFRNAVHDALVKLFVGPDNDETYTLTFDPARDQAEEWPLTL